MEVYRNFNTGVVKIENREINISTSHEACIIEDKNQLSSLVISNGNNPDFTQCHKLIELFVIEIFDWFGKDLSIQSVQSLAKTIYQNYYWLRISELKLFVEKLKAGHWKQVHGMSPAVLMERLGEFARESMSLRETMEINKADMHRSEEKRSNDEIARKETKDAEAISKIKAELYKSTLQEQKTK